MNVIAKGYSCTRPTQRPITRARPLHTPSTRPQQSPDTRPEQTPSTKHSSEGNGAGHPTHTLSSARARSVSLAILLRALSSTSSLRACAGGPGGARDLDTLSFAMRLCACCWAPRAKHTPVHKNAETQTPDTTKWPVLPKSESYSSFDSVLYVCPDRLDSLMDADVKGVPGPLIPVVSSNTNIRSHESIDHEEMPFMSRGRLIFP
jgi:hypothetical protein